MFGKTLRIYSAILSNYGWASLLLFKWMKNLVKAPRHDQMKKFAKTLSFRIIVVKNVVKKNQDAIV